MCEKHPRKGMTSKGRWCRCPNAPWRYRMGDPDPVTGRMGDPKWSPRFPTKEAADADQAARRKAISDGVYASDGGLTLGEWLDEWIARKEEDGTSIRTVQGYRGIIKTWLKPHLGDHRLGRLSQTHVQALIDKAKAEAAHRHPGQHATPSPPAPGTLVNIRACLRAALNDAMVAGKVNRNVAMLVVLPEVKRTKRQTLKPDQVAALRARFDRDPLAGLWYTGLLTAMRRGELAGLALDAVDEAKKLAFCGQQVTSPTGWHDCPVCDGRHRGRLIHPTKSRAGVRVVPIPPPLVGVLLAQRAHLVQQKAAWGSAWSEHGLFFPDPGHAKEKPGAPIRPGFIGHRFGQLLDEAEIAVPEKGGPTLHSLRTGFLTLLAETGVSPDLTAPVAGHVDGDVARRWYIEQSAEAARSAWDQVAGRLTGET